MSAPSAPPVTDAPSATILRAEPISPRRHTMSPERLVRYLRMKVHHLVDERDWRRIHLVGNYDRTAIVSTREKNGKVFNTERPTARACGRDLVVNVYPGADYVHHYALVVATYLAMTGRGGDTVRYELPDPELTRAAAARVDLDLDGHVVVVGWGVSDLAPPSATWVDGHGHAWTSARVGDSRVVYLGFRHSIWGDVAGNVVSRLAALGARAVVYLGKVGSLNPAVEPNTTLASGNRSLVHGAPVTWHDFFGDVATTSPGVHTGTHVTSSSILLENRQWLARHHGHAFVDPEIGPMGAAARAAGIPFGYLHLISNNLARTYPADLSNERRADVLTRRAECLGRIRAILADRLADPRPSLSEIGAPDARRDGGT